MLSLVSCALSQFSPNTASKGWLALPITIIWSLTTINASLFTYWCTHTSRVIQANFTVIRDAYGVFCPICDDQIMYCFVKFCWVVSSRDAVITRLIIIKVHAHWHYFAICWIKAAATLHKICWFENQTHLSREFAGTVKFVKLLPAINIPAWLWLP